MATSDVTEKLLDDMVARLFTNGAGDKAARLVLTSQDCRDLGGWAPGPIRDRLRDLLAAQATARDAEIVRLRAAVQGFMDDPWGPGHQKGCDCVACIKARAALAGGGDVLTKIERSLLDDARRSQPAVEWWIVTLDRLAPAKGRDDAE